MEIADTLRSASELGRVLHEAGHTLVTVESCTGGGIAFAVTAVDGSSNWFERAYVTYSNEAKSEMVSVESALIEKFGAVSEPVARAMAEGGLRASGASCAVAATGIAGPQGGTVNKPVGTVCLAWSVRGQDDLFSSKVETRHYKGDRHAVRARTVDHALNGMIHYLIHRR
ncbi:MAG: CinA family protein [Pseudomonadota bacterium]